MQCLTDALPRPVNTVTHFIFIQTYFGMKWTMNKWKQKPISQSSMSDSRINRTLRGWRCRLHNRSPSSSFDYHSMMGHVFPRLFFVFCFNFSPPNWRWPRIDSLAFRYVHLGCYFVDATHFWVTMEVGGGGGQRVSRNHIANDDVHNERADSLLRGANRRNQTSTACAGIDLCLLAQTEPAEWDDETASASSAFRGVFMPTLLMNVRIHDMSY